MGNSEKRLHFGVMVSSIEEACQSQVWAGIEKFASDNDVDITAYLSIFQQKTGKLEEHYSVVFDSASENRSIDGMIFFGGFIAEDITTESFENYLRGFQEIPKVSIASSHAGIPSLMVNNTRGTYEVVNHLAAHHGAKKIVFVKGPENHEEADARFEGYKLALEDNGIDFDEEYVVSGGGNFSPEDGKEAVKILMKRESFTFDAIVAADDDTATGVIQELNKHGYKIPGDVLIGGFDDAEIASIITPTLTTVRQPFFELGYQAGETLTKLINGEMVLEVEFLPPVLCCRQSCGCIDLPLAPFLIEEVEDTDDLAAYVSSVTKYWFEDEVFQKLPIEYWIKDLVNEITRTPFAVNSFLQRFDQILIYSLQAGAELVVWRDVLTALVNGVHKFQDALQLHFSEISQAIYRASWLINQIQSRGDKFQAIEHNEVQWEIRGYSQEIVTSFNYKELTKKLLEVKEELDINTIYIYEYEKAVMYENWKKPQKVKSILGINDDGLVIQDDDQFEMNFSAIGLGLFTKDRRRTMFIMPLFFGKEQLGMMLMECNPDLPIDAYESIRIAIATAMKGAFLIQEVKNISITDELTGLYNRRGFLTLSYSRLSQLRRKGNSGALFFIDLDGLKPINDSLGHKMGDVAISAAADILKASVREEDIIGRMGGDEYTIFASSVTSEGQERIVARIRDKFEQYNKDNDVPFTLSCSIGAAPLNDFTEDAFNRVLLKADALLYEEKAEKRKRGIGRQ